MDDLISFASTERVALNNLEMVFSKLHTHNLKQCHFFKKSMKFIGHIIDETGVSTDPNKVENIPKMSIHNLVESDGVTPLQKQIQSFLGMVFICGSRA